MVPRGEIKSGKFRTVNFLREHLVLVQSLHSTEAETEAQTSEVLPPESLSW